MRIAICEDGAEDRAQICDHIQAFCDRNAYTCAMEVFSCGEELLEAAADRPFDIAFIDIYMPGINGIEAARALREHCPACLVILVTVSTQHALEGYGVAAISYVVKPLSAEKMEQALAMVRREFEENSRVLEVMAPGGQRLALPLPAIRSVEVYDKTTLFHMQQDSVEARISLDEVERRLGGLPFLRCHRSFLVNLNHVAGVEEQDFLLRDGVRVPIRKKDRRELKLTAARFWAARPGRGGRP